jgi:hypothetical protein
VTSPSFFKKGAGTIFIDKEGALSVNQGPCETGGGKSNAARLNRQSKTDKANPAHHIRK